MDREDVLTRLQRENSDLVILLKSAQERIHDLEDKLSTAHNQIYSGICLGCHGGLQQEFQKLHLDSHQNSASHEEENRALQQSRQELLDQITLLKHENDVFREDFLRERHDRETAQNRLLELEQKLQRAHEELSVAQQLLPQFQENFKSDATRRREEAMRRIREYYNVQQPCRPEVPTRFLSRGNGHVVADGACEDVLEEDEDIIDSMEKLEDTSRTGDAGLECPKCRRTYSVDQHVEFLDHIDQCSA